MTPKEKPQLPGQIALFTDFGEAGPYLGQMESVLLRQGVSIPIVRLQSDAPRYNPSAGAYLLEPLSRHLPAGTMFLCVVDPGVGGDRLPLLIQGKRHWFVGPDNGLFSQVLRRDPGARVQAIEWQPDRISASFHGRDLFAPVAAAVSLGRELAMSPITAAELVGGDWPDRLDEIIYLDHYGNAFTGLRADDLDESALLSVGGVEIGRARTFGDAGRGSPFWYVNSIGLVEIAVNQGRADRMLELEIGQSVSIVQR